MFAKVVKGELLLALRICRFLRDVILEKARPAGEAVTKVSPKARILKRFAAVIS